ncbi:MAG: O-antigen ligase family protein [Dehalococcoidia bacterium]|nr:O-antigen ligase family protein [Dehalococcoidia bacterium]
MSAYAAVARPISGRDNRLPLLAVALVAAVALALLLVTAGGALALLVCAGIVVLALAVVKPISGVYAVMIAALLGDFHINDPNYAAGARLYKSLAPVGISLTPVELVLFAALLGLAIRLIYDDEVRFRAGSLLLPIALFVAAIALASVVGISRGANMATLRQELRGLVYVPVLYLLLTNLLTRREQWMRLMWVFVAFANIASVENIYRYYGDVATTSYSLKVSLALAFAHEDSLLYAAAIVLLTARLVWSRNIMREWKCIALMLLPLAAMLVMRRRAGLVALDGGIIVLCLVLIREKLRTFLVLVPLGLLAMGLVIAVTWNNTGSTGELARSYRSAVGSGQVSARDASSNSYRKREELNIRLNIQGDPVIGLGMGRPYRFYVPVADLSANWPLWDSVPHNSVLWIWMDAGILGFGALTMLFAASICRSMQVLRAISTPMKPYAFAFGAIIFMFIMYSWVDLGMITPRTLTLFALALGGIAALGHIAAAEGDGAPAT